MSLNQKVTGFSGVIQVFYIMQVKRSDSDSSKELAFVQMIVLLKISYTSTRTHASRPYEDIFVETRCHEFSTATRNL